MTTSTFSFDVQHSDDLTFNQWVDRFVQGLSDIGMIQTADTGQTAFLGSPLVSRPGINTNAGYQIWRFNDALATGSPQYPLYCKFEFGTDASTTDPAMDMTVGTSTDGAGTITGSSSDVFPAHSVVFPSSSKSGPCWMVHKDGFLGFLFGKGGQSVTYPEMGWFTAFVCRSCDATGATNGDAFFITSQGFANSVSAVMETHPLHQSVDVATGTKYGTTNSASAAIQSPFGFIPGGDNVDSWTDLNGDTAVFPAFGINPHPFPIPQLVFGWTTDIPQNTTFTATPIGTTQRTYISQPGRVLGGQGGSAVSEGEAAKTMMAFEWE